MGGISEQQLPPCSQRDGVGQFDLVFVFADLNGDRKADRVCIDPDMQAFGYFSTPDGYKNMNQVKKPENKNRANLWWVDINRDGKADIVWIDKFGGDALNVLTDQLNAKIKRVVEKVDSQFPNKYMQFYNIDPQFKGHRFCDVDEQGRERPDPDWKQEAWFLTIAGSDMDPDGTMVPVNDNHYPYSVDLRTVDISACPEPHEYANDYTFSCLLARQIQENPDFEFAGEGDGADLIMPLLEAAKGFHPKTIAHTMSCSAMGD
ncbi:hypothetical protein BDW75DRAFT_246424 [Aspergillus navahoensis]